MLCSPEGYHCVYWIVVLVDCETCGILRYFHVAVSVQSSILSRIEGTSMKRLKALMDEEFAKKLEEELLR